MMKKDKWGSKRYKQANSIYIAPKSKIESRAHYAPEPARGSSDISAADLLLFIFIQYLYLLQQFTKHQWSEAEGDSCPRAQQARP